jgi:hypothetical protein
VQHQPVRRQRSRKERRITPPSSGQTTAGSNGLFFEHRARRCLPLMSNDTHQRAWRWGALNRFGFAELIVMSNERCARIDSTGWRVRRERPQ